MGERTKQIIRSGYRASRAPDERRVPNVHEWGCVVSGERCKAAHAYNMLANAHYIPLPPSACFVSVAVGVMEAASSSSSSEDDYVVGNENLLGVLLDLCDEEDEALLAAFNCSEEVLDDEAEGNHLDQIADI